MFDDVANAGIRDVVPIHEVSKVFYADTGKILNIGGDGESNNPVLLIKRDIHADPPRRMLQRSRSVDHFHFSDCDTSDEDTSEIDAVLTTEAAPDLNLPETNEHADSQAWRLPSNLDSEWIAFEVYNDENNSDSDHDDFDTPSTDTPPSRAERSRYTSPEPAIASALSKLTLRSETAPPSPNRNSHLSPDPLPLNAVLQLSPNKRNQPVIKTSLSLLEMLTKLAALQQFRQESHLAIEDELLNFFLEEIGPAVYNRAIHDAQARLQQRVADLDGELFVDEFQYWTKVGGRRR